MSALELAQQEYVQSAALVPAAGEEHARARMALLAAQESGDPEETAIAGLRSAYATKLWEARLRDVAVALRKYNEQLRMEARRCQERSELKQRLRLLDEEGQFLCSVQALMIPRESPWWQQR